MRTTLENLFDKAAAFGERCLFSPVYWVIVILMWAVALAGCASRPPQTDDRQNAGIVAPPVGLDTRASPAPDSITVTPRQTLLDKLRGKTPAPQRVPAGTAIRTGKKATVNVYNAPATITTIGKKANAATGDGAKVAVAGKNSTQATDSATALATGGGAAAAGTGASASGGAAPVEAKGWAATLAHNLTAWVPYVAVGVVLLGLFWLWRKKKQAEILLP